MATAEHRSKKIECVNCAVITVSDTRTHETDVGGKLICTRLESAGHHVASHEIIPDDTARIRNRIVELCDNRTIDIVLLTGGTGLAPRDTTCEALGTLCEKLIDGFGELFRMLSYEEVGSAAMLSRATAGVCRSTAVFSIPGSTGAVTLAMDKLILPELGHVASLLRE